MAVSRSRARVMSMFIMSICTLASRTLGFVRELLFVRYLGAKILSDAFLTAFSIPNTFYEIFVGGASGSTVLPFLLYLEYQEGAHTVNQVLTAFLASMLGIISCVCLIIAKYPLNLLGFLVPGFIPEQIRVTVVLLRIFLLFMLSSGATSILAEALRAKRYFFIPAMGQVIVNIAFIGGLASYGLLGIHITSVAYCVVAGGIAQCCVQLGTCWYAGYRPAFPSRTTGRYVMGLLHRFFPCMITSGINEIALFIERQFASYLPVGSISLMTYASSIMRLPFGLLVYPLTTVIMPELAKAQRSPARVAFLMFEVCKFILWIIVPLVILLSWFSYDIFGTLYGASKLSVAALLVLRNLLLIKLCGLAFLSMNHVCLQIFYARHEVYLPTMVSLVTASCSIGATYLMYPRYGIYGIAVASVATMMVRTVLFMALLHKRIRIGRYGRRFKKFLGRATVQWLCTVPLWLLIISTIRSFLRAVSWNATWYADGVGLWLWVAPCVLLLIAMLWITRRRCGLRFYCMK